MITRERARELRAVIESAVSAYGLDDAAADVVDAYLDSFIEGHKAEYVAWLFKPDSSQWQEPPAPLLTREEVLEMRLIYSL